MNGLRQIALSACLLVLAAGCKVNSSGNSSNILTGNHAEANTSSTPTGDGLNVQTVMIDSSDGVKLIGTFYDSGKQTSPAVLLLHQWQSDRHSYDDFARQLNTDGFVVLSIDGRGFGQSVKTSDGKTVEPSRTIEAVKGMLGDVGAAFDFLSLQKNVDPTRIGIAGASYGSSLAILYAADERSVRAVILLSPGLNYFGNMPTEPAVKKYGDRALLLVAADDDAESADAARKLKAMSDTDKYELKIYPKGGHGTGLFNSKVGLEDLLDEFFTKRLTPPVLL